MFFSLIRNDHLPNKPHACQLFMTKILSVTPRFESMSDFDYALSETQLQALLIRLTDNIKDCSHLPAIVGIFIWFILVSYKIKTKPPRFYVLASAAIAR